MTLIDFDGTIVDLWPRYHAVFCALTGARVDLETYRRAKRIHKRDSDLALYLGVALPADYFPRKAALLEDPAYLALDRLLLPARKLLRFMEAADACILTARRRPDQFLWELDHLGLSQLRSSAVCVSGPKAEWVARNAPDAGVIIGDDVRDLQVAGESRLEAVMVRTGLHTAEDFRAADLPHRLVDSLEEYIDRGTTNGIS